MQTTLDRFSNLSEWSTLIDPSIPFKRFVPHEIISFDCDGQFSKYLLSSNSTTQPLPSDPRIQPLDWHQTAKEQFRDETIMERQSGWDEKCKAAFGDNNEKSSATSASSTTTTTTVTSTATTSTTEVPSFSNIVDELEVAIDRLCKKKVIVSLDTDGVCISGAYSFADDAGWATSTNTPSCISLLDIFTTLTSSTKLTRDLRKQKENCKYNNKSTSGKIFFAIRPWLDINASTEWRVFVESGKIIGICQRCMDQLFPHLFDFAVPLLPHERQEEEPEEEEEGEKEDEKCEENHDNNDVKRALTWSKQVCEFVHKSILLSISTKKQRNEQEEEEEEEREGEMMKRVDSWIKNPTLIIDLVHEGPARGCAEILPSILGIRAVESFNSFPEEQKEQQEVFRIFGSVEGLRSWNESVEKYFQRNLQKEDDDEEEEEEEERNQQQHVVRIATCADDLSRDSRAANRGGVPLEFEHPEMYSAVLQQVSSSSSVTGNNNNNNINNNNNNNNNNQVRPGNSILEEIVKARAHVHGDNDLKN